MHGRLSIIRKTENAIVCNFLNIPYAMINTKEQTETHEPKGAYYV